MLDDFLILTLVFQRQLKRLNSWIVNWLLRAAMGILFLKTAQIPCYKKLFSLKRIYQGKIAHFKYSCYKSDSLGRKFWGQRAESLLGSFLESTHLWRRNDYRTGRREKVKLWYGFLVTIYWGQGNTKAHSPLWVRPSRLPLQSCCCVHLTFDAYLSPLGLCYFGVLLLHLLLRGLVS